LAVIVGVACSIASTAGLEGVSALLVIIGTSAVLWGQRDRLARGIRNALGGAWPTVALASAALAAAPRRLWVLVSAVMLSTLLVVTTTVLAAGLERVVGTMFRSWDDAEYVVQTVPLGELAIGQILPESWVQKLHDLPGRLTIDRFDILYLDGRPALVEGLGRASNDPIMQLASASARRAVETGRSVIVTRRFAAVLDVKAGTTIDLATPSGRHRVRVADIVDLTTIQQGAVALNATLERRWFGGEGASRVEITKMPGERPSSSRAIADALVGAPVPVTVSTGRGLRVASEDRFEQVLRGLTALGWVAAVVVSVAVLDSIALSVIQRRRELGVLRALGARRRHVVGMVVAETAIAATVGCLLGSLISLSLVHNGSVLADTITGFRIHDHVGIHLMLSSVLGALSIALVAAAIPAWSATRVRVVDALASR
jgi:putative ABC transport system permease protein